MLQRRIWSVSFGIPEKDQNGIKDIYAMPPKVGQKLLGAIQYNPLKIPGYYFF
jgi:hypothetical protein